MSMQAEFALALCEDLKKKQKVDVTDSQLRLLINDIRKFMREDEDDYETNQEIIGIKYFFRGFSIKARKGTHEDKKKYTNLNRIVNQHCMAYYCKC